MKPSFLKLVITSVLSAWLLGFGAIFIYVVNQDWAEDEGREIGVFLAYRILDETAAEHRPEVLRNLRADSSLPLTLMPLEEIKARVGQSISPGDRIPLRVSYKEAWYFLVFRDGHGGVGMGPVNPIVPIKRIPLGVFLGLIGVPLLAGFITLRVGRELSKVEDASEALAVGELGARVDNPGGPSSELAKKFNAMAEKMERLIKSRDELVQAVSHELGSPLSRLRFHMELLTHQTDEQREDRLDSMSRELDALDDLVAELLNYVQSDELELNIERFDPVHELSNLVELAALEPHQEASVDFLVKTAEPITLRADRRLFQRAIENLLRNAARYAQNQVKVVLSSHAKGVVVAVHDDGPGIPPEFRQRVLAPFCRVDRERGKKTGGVGLGLAIVKRIVERHGAQMSIDDSDLGGAAVTIRWLDLA